MITRRWSKKWQHRLGPFEPEELRAFAFDEGVCGKSTGHIRASADLQTDSPGFDSDCHYVRRPAMIGIVFLYGVFGLLAVVSTVAAIMLARME